MGRRLRAIVVLVAVLAGVIAPSPAGAIEWSRDGAHCDLVSLHTGFIVRWSGEIGTSAGEVDRLVVERQVFGTWWWRGTATWGYFEDGPAPRNAAKAEYRVTAKAADGTVLGRLRCEPVKHFNIQCLVVSTPNGDEIRITEPVFGADGAEVDYVLRRSVSTDGPTYWRARSDDGSFVDTPPSWATPTYEVWARADRVIIGGATCVPDVLASACVVAHGEVRPEPAPVDQARQDELTALVLAVEPEAEQLRFPTNGRVYFVAPDDLNGGLASIYVYDPATDGVTWIRYTGSFMDLFGLGYIDDAGGIYYAGYSNEGVGYAYLAPNGDVRSMGSDYGGRALWVQPVGRFADGRTVLTRYESNLDGGFLSRQVILQDSFTGAEEVVAELDSWTYLIGVAADGSLIFDRSAVWDRSGFFTASVDCLRGSAG